MLRYNPDVKHLTYPKHGLSMNFFSKTGIYVNNPKKNVCAIIMYLLEHKLISMALTFFFGLFT
jgi:hypothetical protein